MLITIITVSFNAKKNIQNSIDSITSQNAKNIEYIVVDGNSQDGTQEILRGQEKIIDKLLIEPDDGIYNAMNKALNLASGDYIYFLGSDDYLIDKFVIDEVTSFIYDNHFPLFIYGNIEVRPREGKSYIHKPSPPEKVLDELITGCLPHQASFAHKSLFQNEEIGVFNENYKSAADYEWFLKLASFADKTSHSLIYYDRIIASYNADGRSSNLEIALEEMFKIQNKIPIYQSLFWMQRRIETYQNIIMKPNGHWNLQRSLESMQKAGDIVYHRYQDLQLQHQNLHKEYQKLTELAHQSLTELNDIKSRHLLHSLLYNFKIYIKSQLASKFKS